MKTTVLELPSAKQVYYVTWEDLPLSCPTPQMSVWDSHPRIYLPLQVSGKEQCPYCGSTYILKKTDIRDTPPLADNTEIESDYHTLVTQQRIATTESTSDGEIHMRVTDFDADLDRALDEALMGTFPASDPVSISVRYPWVRN